MILFCSTQYFILEYPFFMIPTTIDDLGPSILSLSTAEIIQKTQLILSETRILKSEVSRLSYELQSKKDAIKDNQAKIKMHTQLPYLVGIFQERLNENNNKNKPKTEYKDPKTDFANESNSNGENTKENTNSECIVTSSQRSSAYLRMPGLVDIESLLPGDQIALHKDTNLIFEKLPNDFDIRVKAMQLDQKPSETYEDIGGLERQIEELSEAIVLPFLFPEKFKKLNIKPPKGCLMYGPPGTGKTLMARACASKTDATFLKLAGSQLVQMYIGDGARLVRDAFSLAREKQPCIIFIDEIDAIGTKRIDSDRTGDREVQRTMLELLNQLDGFAMDDNIKVIAATNRIDILDAALLRSGRLDRKIEFPLPNIDGRKRIMQIHARKMTIGDINFDELAKCTVDFNGAMLKAVCVEAGVVAMRKEKDQIEHEDFMEGINEVLAKKKNSINYYT